MKNKAFYILLLAFVWTSCSSEFEKIRTSNSPKLILDSAYKYYNNEEYYRAQSLLEEAIQYYRGQKEAEDIYYHLAYTHYHLNEFVLASYYFENFAKTFYNSDKKEEADFMSAYANFRMSPNYKLDQSYSQKAVDGFQKFINTYPTSNRVDECNSLIDEMRKKLELKAYNQGLLYYQIGQYQAALNSFDIMLKDFPESSKNEEVRYLMLKASYEYAMNSVYEKKEERFLTTLKLYNKFIKRHPDSKKVKEVKDIYKSSQSQLEKYKI